MTLTLAEKIIKSHLVSGEMKAGIEDLLSQIENKTITVTNKSKNKEYKMNLEISPRQRELLKSGGLLNHMKNREMAK